MIRAETATDWLLIKHADHARLAGEFADAWGNDTFARPEPFNPLRFAIYHHDDGWHTRDAAPVLTGAGRPEAFTRELVGTYAAFEEIDLPSYLAVRGAATAAVAAENAYAGIVVSMHTVNLLTEQADLASIRPEHRAAHATFIAEQLEWQRVTATRLGAAPGDLERAFQFLQCCDNLSLIACSGYDASRPLRHQHPDHRGQRHTLTCTPAGPGTWRITPWPFARAIHTFTVPVRRVPKSACTNLPTFRAAFAAAPAETLTLTLQSA